VPSPESRLSKKSFSPSATTAGVSGLPGGMTDPCQIHREPDLILRARIRQRAGFWQRRRLTWRERRQRAGFDVFASRQRREKCAEANSNSRRDYDQTGCCKSFARHRAVILIAVRSARALPSNRF
jgi:hypothetical protein